MSQVQPVTWYGSKYNSLNFIHDLLPPVDVAPQFVLPFGGSGVTLWSREPAKVETWNDIDSELYNFMSVVLHNEDELLTILEDKSFYSRELFQDAQELRPDDDVMRAFYFLVRNAQAFNSVSGGSWGSSVATSRRGKSQRVAAWEHRIDQIRETYERMTHSRLRMRVQIENRPAIDVIQRHDREDTQFYCDPPYPPEARESTGQYNCEMDTDDHEELAEVLNDVDGYVVLSGYECDLLNDLYEGWWLNSEGEKMLAGEGTGSREEVCYTNYDPSEVGE